MFLRGLSLFKFRIILDEEYTIFADIILTNYEP